MNSNEPDILAGYNSAHSDDEDLVKVKIDLAELTNEAFQSRYKATKRQYSALMNGIVSLRAVYQALSDPGPLEIDSNITDTTNYLIQDYLDLLEQMFLAAYWEREGM